MSGADKTYPNYDVAELRAGVEKLQISLASLQQAVHNIGHAVLTLAGPESNFSSSAFENLVVRLTELEKHLTEKLANED
jgi:hypothetical protein